MRTTSLLLATLAGISSLATAQNDVTVPEGFENNYTGNTTLLWRSTAFRYQCVYDPQHFLNQNLNYPIEITQLSFRALNGTVDAGGQVYSNVTIELSTGVFDSQTMDTTFANNTGADAVVVYQGDVTLLPSTGTTPNNHHIVITLQTPFVYDASNGPLLCDVTAPTAPTATVPNMAASNDYLTQFARRNSSATPTATAGGLSGFAAAMKIDYNILPGTALSTEYGNACYERPRMVYEDIAGDTQPIDLVNTAYTMVYAPNAVGGNYVISQGGFPYAVPTGGTDIVLGPWTSTSVAAPGSWDDASLVVTPATLASGFDFPGPNGGGSTTELTINSNGKVYLGNTVDATFATNGAPYGSLDPFSGASGAGLPVLAVFNCDLDPTTGGSIWYEDPSPNGGVRITWDNILNWQDTTAGAPVAGPNSCQVEFFPGGLINIAYGNNLTNGGSNANNALVGFSAGGAEPATTPVDWSSLIGYESGDGTEPVTLSADARPITGSTVNLVTGGIPAGAFGSLLILSTGATVPGLDLGIIGMPGCDGNLASIDFSTFFPNTGPTATYVQSVPNNPNLAGYQLFAQTLVLVSGVNAFNGQTTNGVELLVGTL